MLFSVFFLLLKHFFFCSDLNKVSWFDIVDYRVKPHWTSNFKSPWGQHFRHFCPISVQGNRHSENLRKALVSEKIFGNFFEFAKVLQNLLVLVIVDYADTLSVMVKVKKIASLLRHWLQSNVDQWPCRHSVRVVVDYADPCRRGCWLHPWYPCSCWWRGWDNDYMDTMGGRVGVGWWVGNGGIFVALPDTK